MSETCESFVKQECEKEEDGVSSEMCRTVINSTLDENVLEPEVKILSCLDSLDYGYCNLCETSLYLLKAHKAFFHQNKPEIRCIFCGQFFLKRSKLVKHILKTHELNHIKCAYCGRYDFKEFEELDNHLEEHVFLHVFICHVCHQSFALKSNLDEHLSYHLSSWKLPSLQCPSCERLFKSQRSGILRMKQHYFEDHSKELKCPVCDKSFAKFIVFYNHFLRHKKLLPFACEECGLCFRKKCLLRDHTETMHGNKRSYECSVCHHLFKHKPSFDAHMRSHDELLRFSCNYCAKLFLRKVSLLDHFVEKSCQLCNEEFFCKTTFDSHFELNHKTERLFGCDKCSKTYVLENALKRHKTLIHPVKGQQVLKCPLCSYVTATKHNLNRHKRRNHSSK